MISLRLEDDICGDGHGAVAGLGSCWHGPDGAGKTTTIRMLLGLVHPTSGSGTILGGSLAEPATYLHKVGALIESPAFYPQLSGRENLKALARLGRLPLAAADPVLEALCTSSSHLRRR